MSLRENWENLSCLFPSSCFLFQLCSFWPKYFSSSLHLSICNHCPTSSSHLSLSSTSFFSLYVPYSPTILILPVILSLRRVLYSRLLFLLTSAISRLYLYFLCLHLYSQLTFAMRRCSCARTAERVTRTRSASVLQNLRGSCANTPAVRRARTATLPLPCTPPRPLCCSALC